MNWKTVSYLCLFLLVFIDPFFFNVPVGPLRVTAIRVVIGGLTFIMLFRLLVFEDIIKRQIGYPVLFLFVWFLYGFISILWTTDKVTGIKELYYFGTFLLFILLLIYLLKMKNHRFWINQSFWLMGIITIGISLLELALNYHLPTSRIVLEADRFSESSTRVATAFFYNENDLATFLVILFPFFLVNLLKTTAFGKFLNIMIMLLIFVITFANLARIATISLLIQVLLFIYLTKKDWFYRGICLALLFSPILLGLSWVLLGDKFATLIDLEGLKQGYGSGFIRLNLYLNGVYALFQSFMLGVGPGNFQEHIYPMFNTKGIVNPHNWWVEVLTNYGFMIFCGYVVFYWFCLKNTFQLYQKNVKSNHLALTLFLSLSGFIFASIGPSRLFYFWPMWLLIGVVLAYINNNKETASFGLLRREL